MRVLLILILLLAMTGGVNAQSGDCPQPQIIETGRHGATLPGVSLQAFEIPSSSSNVIGDLPPETLFQVMGEPECVEEVRWYNVATMSGVYGAWIPEQIDGANVVEVYRFIPEAPIPFDVSMNPPAMPAQDTPLPTVTPVELTNTDALVFADYDWEAFSAQVYEPQPDPAALILPESYQGDLPSAPVNLGEVYFVEDARLNEAQLTLLAQNGFVVVPSPYQQFDAAYNEIYESETNWLHGEGKGDFITTDVMLHSFFFTYQNLLMFLEMEQFYGGVSRFVGGGFLNAQQTWRDLAGSPLEANARNAAIYYAVPLLLLREGEDSYVIGYEQRSGFENESDIPSVVIQQMASTLLAEAQGIVDMIRTAQGVQTVPILDDGEEDFSQYQVRGYYAGNPLLESYFRAMMWLGRITFRVQSADETRTSLLVMDAITQSDDAMASYRAIGDALDFLVGPMDDLSIKDVMPAASVAFGEAFDPQTFSDDTRFGQYRDALNQLPAPRVNSIPIGQITVEELAESTRGFRLFGQRFTFDGYAMQQLIYPEVGTDSLSRTLPLGLDVPAIFGSDVAYGLTDEAGATEYANYVEHVTALREEVSGIAAESWLDNANGGWLWMLQPLASRDLDLIPPLMQTEAWRRRELSTYLGSWTELKHATLLYAEQPMGGLGGGGMEPPVISYSFVEPNPQVFARIAILSAVLRDGLLDRGLITTGWTGRIADQMGSNFVTVGTLSARLAEIARAEIAGEEIPYATYYYLQERIGQDLWYIRYSVEQFLADPPETVALVADVASNAASGEALHVAIADPDFIYVVTNSPYGLTLTRGAVYSYYEFINPIDERMTDDEWRALVATGETPARPAWTELYLAE